MAEPTSTTINTATAGTGSSGRQQQQQQQQQQEPGFERLNIPFIIDKVDVTDPELIRRITTHSDVGRVHAVPTKNKPW